MAIGHREKGGVVLAGVLIMSVALYFLSCYIQSKAYKTHTGRCAIASSVGTAVVGAAVFFDNPPMVMAATLWTGAMMVVTTYNILKP